MWRRVVILLLVLTGPARAETFQFPALQSPSRQVTIEASGDIEAVEPLIRDFQKLYPDVAVTYTDRLTNDLFDQMRSACERGEAVADVVFSSSVDHMVKLANDGCAAAYTSAETRRLPATLRWHDEVFGFTYEPAVIVFNRDLLELSDVPLTHAALADLLRRNPAAFQGRVGTYDIARSGIGYLFGFYDAQQSSAFGRLMEAFGRAEAKLYCCTGELLREIESGRIVIGYNLLGSYAYGRLKAGAPIGIVLPGDYTLVLARAAFLPKYARNAGEGRLFLDYLLSLRGQTVAARESFYFVQSEPPPEGVLAPGTGQEAGVFRQIPIGPELLAVTDQHKRRKLLGEWQKSVGSTPP